MDDIRFKSENELAKMLGMLFHLMQLLLIDVRLLDHVIVAHGGLAYSFAEEAIYKK